jgi:3-hydroxybutyryl-CoA dehydratase
MEKEYFEDYVTGEKFKSPGRTITESDIGTFAGFSGDWHELHTNLDYAKKSIFGERIAHGMLVLSLGSALGLRIGSVVTPKSFIAFYGMDKVRFVNPVKIGDTLYNEMETTETKAKDDGRGVVTTEAHIVNQRGEDCCVYIAKMLCGRRPLS